MPLTLPFELKSQEASKNPISHIIPQKKTGKIYDYNIILS